MIKTIIKRDGTEEPFSMPKLMGWGEWAASSLNGRVDWQSVVRSVLGRVKGDALKSSELQNAFIDECLSRATWSYYLMAGRLYASIRHKEIFGKTIPTIKAVQTNLHDLGLMRKLNYTDGDYEILENLIDHQYDYAYPHFSLKYINDKYAMQNRVTGQVYETPQFTYMRMAMVVYEKEPLEIRIRQITEMFNHFREKELSAPTPNYVYLGATTMGLASCCLYTTADDGESLATGDYIANIMTQAGAGIGANIITRGVGEPVRGGSIKHGGKLSYLRANAFSTTANKQGSRGGAGNVNYTIFDPEAPVLSQLRNPRALASARIRELHYTVQSNPFLDWKAANNQPIMAFSCNTAPDLFAAFYSSDLEKFVTLYHKYEQDETFPKKWLDARELLYTMVKEAYETGTAYFNDMYEINHHTPFKEAIYGTNLCVEIAEVTKPYMNAADLYLEEDHGRGEVALCSLFGVNVNKADTTEKVKSVCYHGLRMVDFCIHNSDYKLPHVGYTAKQRMNAAGGIMGLASHMAKNRLSYTSDAGLQEIHFIYERHMYCMIEASLRIAKERGNAPWIHKTKWPEGWLPLDTYNRNVDGLSNFQNLFNWDKLRARIVENGGIAHSVLVGHMPGESSSKALGETNSGYPVRKKVIKKSDGQTVIYWAAPNSDDPDWFYELAYDISTRRQAEIYAVEQKWTDQAISADFYRRIDPEVKISSSQVLEDEYFYPKFLGMKSRYYQNSEITSGIDLESMESAIEISGSSSCDSGACSL
jgi:ribonucleoside-diphosphate reductase alpha chain